MTEQIRVTEDMWEQLNSRKKPGDSFNDVLQRLVQNDEHRLADAEPNPERLTDAEPETQPADAPRDENDDPVLEDTNDD